MGYRIGALIVSLAVTGGAWAQEAGDQDDPGDETAVGICLDMQADALRLVCYDMVFGFEPGEEAGPVSTSGGWQFVDQEDEFTNQTTSYVFLRSDQADNSFSDAPAELVVRCDGRGSTEIFVISNGYIGARNDTIPVRYRFGDDAPVSEHWNESTTGTAAFLPRGYQDFRAGLATRQDFIFEITDFRGSRYSASFDGLSVNDEMLDYVLGGCQ